MVIEIVKEGKEAPELFKGIKPEDIKDVDKPPGTSSVNETKGEQNISPRQEASPAAGNDNKKTAAQLLADFANETVNPPVPETTQGDEVDDDMKALHAALLNEDTIAEWMVKVICWGFKHINVLVFNFAQPLIFKAKKKVDAKDIEIDRQDRLTIEKCCHIYAPKIMEMLKKLNPIVLGLLFMEGNMIAQMNSKAKLIPVETEKKK